ncbi:MAG TPA: hypothetical protein VGF40_07565 [Thermoanaerobaculia bacterium]
MNRILAATLLGMVWSAAALADGEVLKNVKQAVPATGIRQVRIEIPIAELEVRNGPASSVQLAGTIRQRYSDNDDREWASEIVESTGIALEVSGDVVFVRRDAGPETRSWRAKRSPSDIKATISVPAGMAVDIEQSIGEIDIAGSFGDIDLAVRIGEVSIRVPKRDIRHLSASAKIGEAKTNLGDRVITKEGLFAGETYYENETGKHDLRVRVQIGEIEIDLTD